MDVWRRDTVLAAEGCRLADCRARVGRWLLQGCSLGRAAALAAVGRPPGARQPMEASAIPAASRPSRFSAYLEDQFGDGGNRPGLPTASHCITYRLLSELRTAADCASAAGPYARSVRSPIRQWAVPSRATTGLGRTRRSAAAVSPDGLCALRDGAGRVTGTVSRGRSRLSGRAPQSPACRLRWLASSPETVSTTRTRRRHGRRCLDSRMDVTGSDSHGLLMSLCMRLSEAWQQA